MLCGQVFDRFVAKCPVTVMIRAPAGSRASTPRPSTNCSWTRPNANTPRSCSSAPPSILLATVVCRIHRSVHAAYKDNEEEVGVSVRSLYDKLATTETGLSEALVRHSAEQLRPILPLLQAALPPYVKGYKTKILDGNHLAATQRRLKELRDAAAGALPGQTLVVLEPELQLATDVYCCEDAHAQERSLPSPRPAPTALPRGTCGLPTATSAPLPFWPAWPRGRSRRFFLEIRQHGSTLSWEKQSRRKRVGRIDEGVVYEQRLWLKDGAGGELEVRRVTLVLDKPTCDGDTEIHLITNLPSRVSAKRVAQVYRKRWTIEQLFLNLTTILRCELNTLPYPKAALFGFCVALAAANLLGTAKGSLRAAHGAEAAEQVSDYHLATQVAGTYQGMLIALPAGRLELPGRTAGGGVRPVVASALARRVKPAALPQASARPCKKPRPRRTRFARKKHIATSRLLDGYYDTK